MAADLGYFVDDVTVKARTCLRQMCWDTTGIYVRLPLLDFYLHCVYPLVCFKHLLPVADPRPQTDSGADLTSLGRKNVDLQPERP